MYADPETGEQRTRYGTILKILVCSVPGQAGQPFAEMLWHTVIDETNCCGRLPLLERGKTTDDVNLNYRGVPFSQAYAQNVSYLPQFQQTRNKNKKQKQDQNKPPKTDKKKIVALYRLADYNPLHDFKK
jgi:hypothetical protein